MPSYASLPIVLTLVLALATLSSLTECQFLSRFSQESYDCSTVSAPFNRVVFSDVFEGATGVVEGNTIGEVTIISASDTYINADWGKGRIQLWRDTGRVVTTNNRIVRTYNCKHAKFKM
jgi:hypothetical protein